MLLGMILISSIHQRQAIITPLYSSYKETR